MTASTERAVETDRPVERAIKIFHLIGTLERGGGTEEGMVMTIPRLDRDRFVNVVCSITDLMPLKAEYERRGIAVHTLGARGKWDLRAVRRLLQMLKSERPDILHCYLFHGNILGRVAGRIAGVPAIVSSERSVGHHSRAGIILNRLTSGLVTAVETNSEAGKEFVRTTLGYREDKVFAVHPGVVTDTTGRDDGVALRQELGVGASAPLAAYVGRLHPAKGLPDCLEAFAAVARQMPEARLLLAGDGPDRSRLEEIAKSRGLEGSVRFLGQRPDTAAIMLAADVLVLSSTREGFPRVVLEAMAMRKPVVATRVGGVGEAIEHGVTGLLVPPGNPASLAAALLEILADREAATRMGIAGKARLEKAFTVGHAAHRYERFYQRFVKRPSGMASLGAETR